ncbi:Response regulator, SirA family [Desulfonema limicola]|uniref:Response regulator, SirA family n=1 Tax=Desulfonema limicola TaxID=45656 RepID=A0A975BBH8_9BACT|nr:sulfurtransferase TusA family protein [Desulfonema limicola]QTA82292.1 Response regulator, SirA family [Desulfonema limicola]
MKNIVDARGLSCPQPVLMVMDAFKKIEKGEILVMTDTQASKENVSRAAESKGWTVKSVQEQNQEFHLKLTRS